MAEELQALLDRIQNEGVAKAEAESNRILDEAKSHAADILAKARAEEAEARKRAEEESRQFRERAEASVRQAARDVLLEVETAVRDTLDRLLLAKVSGSFGDSSVRDAVRELLLRYARGADGGDVAFSLSPELCHAVRDSLLADLRQAAAQGVEVRPDDDLGAGFRVALQGGRVEYDFSARAIAEEMGRLLRPELARLVRGE
jgi:vacuolar-type H+-ATPase subunit E/Vma4